MTLVPIPWQPSYFLTPDTLSMLQLASAHAGHNVLVSDAWRSYAEQKGFHDAYLAYLRGGPYAPVASDPDDGQRNHMRAAAVDIQNRADRAAMLAVGFTPDPDEWWHFNNPRWASMPIIKTNTATASTEAHTLQEDDDMATPLYAIVQAHNSPSKYLRHPGGLSPIFNQDPELKMVERFVAMINEGNEPDMFEAQLQAIDAIMRRPANATK